MTSDPSPALRAASRDAVPVDVPGDATLVPGVAGSRHDDAAARALVASLRAALDGAERVRVDVAHADGGAWTRPVPDLGALGVDDAWTAWRFHGNDAPDAPRAGVAATVALLALGAAGWQGPVDVRAAATGRDGAIVRVERAC